MSHEADQDPSVLMKAAVRQVDRLNRAVNRYRVFVIILSAVSLALVAGGIVLGILWGNTQSVLARQAQDTRVQAEQSYQSCLAGNEYRTGNQQIWVEFARLVTKGKPVPEATQFLAYVSKVDKLRNCAPLRPPG